MKSEVRGQLDLLLLSVLEDAPAHGYAIIERLRARGEGAFDFPEGTIYPALHRLEREGLLASKWMENAPRRRRVYSLTRSGQTALGHETEDWRRFSRAIEAVMAGGA